MLCKEQLVTFKYKGIRVKCNLVPNKELSLGDIRAGMKDCFKSYYRSLKIKKCDFDFVCKYLWFDLATRLIKYFNCVEVELNYKNQYGITVYKTDEEDEDL